MNEYEISLIVKIFETIPFQKILAIARNIQSKLEIDENLKQEKSSGELVTLADTKIQALVLQYFLNSPLVGTYLVKAEEAVERKEVIGTKSWQLLVDPLDGTSSFCKGKETWGVMIGACDKKGILQYSWNLVSTGDIYKTSDKRPLSLQSFKNKIANGQSLKVDVYDYGSSAAEKFKEIFEDSFNISSGQYEQTSYPAAAWTGWQLNMGKLDALLWLSSDKGKRWYPDYDLIFLGALERKGYKIRLGKIERKNSIVVIAPSDEDADKLYKVGLKLITEEQRKNIILVDNPLEITGDI